MKKIGLAIIIVFLPVIVLYAQENVPVQPIVKVSGYVKSDFFYDSRQTINAREGHFLLYPAPHEFGMDNSDINERPSFNMLSIQSNLSVKTTGFSVLGAEVTGLVEGDFFGGSNTDVNMLRLRHAYIRINWKKTEILVGQYWHPVFSPSCYPGTVSFNTGAPIQPFSRAPQIKISRMAGLLKFSGALLSQRDYASVGPLGTSSRYIRDSGIPEIQLSGELNHKSRGETVLGASIGYKRLTPQIRTGKNYKTDETVRGLSANIYFKQVGKLVTIKMEGIFLENGSEFLSIGGYAVKDSIDAERGLVTYEGLRTVSGWGEIQLGGKVVQVALFSGYTMNLGTSGAIKGPVYLTSNAPIRRLYRISPRLCIVHGNLTFAAEIEYTSALYGVPDDHARMVKNSEVQNLRFLVSTAYKF